MMKNIQKAPYEMHLSEFNNGILVLLRPLGFDR